VVRVRLANGVRIDARPVTVKSAGQATTVSIRPEKLTFTEQLGSAANRIPARFITRHYVGEYIRYHFRSSCGTELVVKSLNDSAAPRFTRDQDVALSWRPEHGHALDHPGTASAATDSTQSIKGVL